jgi:hypothetical protein
MFFIKSMLRLFKGLKIFTKMYVREPADLQNFYVDISSAGTVRTVSADAPPNPQHHKPR